jgi:hypothetical protein
MIMEMTGTEAEPPPAAPAAGPAETAALNETAALAEALGAAQVTAAVAGLRRRLADTTVRVAVMGSRRSGRTTLCAQLREAGIPADAELVDTPAIDGSLEDLAHAVTEAADTVIVLFAVPAYAALSRTETEFLTIELLSNRLAHVVLVVTHLDRVDEPDRVLNAVRRQAESLGPRLTVLPGPGRDADEKRVHAVVQAIADIDADAITAEREHQVAVRLGAEAKVLTALAQAAQARQTDRAADRAAVAEQESAWRDLRAAFIRRQQQLRDRLTGQVDDEREALVRALTPELISADDPVAWWTAELPRRLGELLLDVGRRLEETRRQRAAAGGQWLELELRAGLGIDGFAAGAAGAGLPTVAATTAAPGQGVPAARGRLLRDLVRVLGPAVQPLLSITRKFRGKAALTLLAEPALELLGMQLEKMAAEQRRAALAAQLTTLVGHNLDAYKRVVLDSLAADEREELERLDGRWQDWQAVRTAATDADAPDPAGWLDRARALSQRVEVLQQTIKGSRS